MYFPSDREPVTAPWRETVVGAPLVDASVVYSGSLQRDRTMAEQDEHSPQNKHIEQYLVVTVRYRKGPLSQKSLLPCNV